jgi:hypothetical protein
MGRPYESHPGLLRLAAFIVECMNFCPWNWQGEEVYFIGGHLHDLYVLF